MNLMDLFVKIGVDDQASDKIDTLSSKFKKGLTTAAKVGTAAIGAAATGIAALAKASIDQYAEYEQLTGGVDTLFKSSSDKVMAYAENAYKTAGLSANEYMSTVTSFSASLLQSLGGDTEAAADYADMAITDMSDNANKMGTSMEMIQNAYQGFAKGNMTMLDNLKLGYGGTKEEMERLLDDASKISGIEYDISSYADIVDAIHVVQTEMGITGTTAKEASSTIQGSVSAMKSAWSNLVTGIADENANIDKLIGNFVDSVGTVGKNIMPRVEKIIGGIGQLITKMAPVATDAISSVISDVLPSLLNAGVQMLGAISQGILENIDLLIQDALDIVLMLGQGIADNAGNIVDGAASIINSLATWLNEYSGVLVDNAVEIILTLVDGIINNIDSLVESAIYIIGALGEGILRALPILVEKAPVIISNLVSAIVNNAPKLLQAAWEVVKELVTGIVDNFPMILDAAVGIIDTISDGINNLYWSLINLGVGIVQDIADGIASAWNDLVSWFSGLWDSLFGNRSVDVSVNKSSNVGVNGSHASGLSYVPFDGYIAELHKGERVLTAKEARQYNSGTQDERPIVITVQSVLDGRVIGETAYKYNRQKARAMGT